MTRIAIICLLCCGVGLPLTAPATAQGVDLSAPQARSFIVIQLQHASPLLIAYAVQADDVIWEDTGSSGGGGYGSSGRSGSSSGQQSYSSGRGGSGYSGRSSAGSRQR